MSARTFHKFQLLHHEDFTAPSRKFRLVKVVRSGDQKNGFKWNYFLIDDFETSDVAFERADVLAEAEDNPRISFTIYNDQRRMLSR